METFTLHYMAQPQQQRREPGQIPTWSLGDRLRKARETAGIDSEEMADLLGISRKTVYNYEHDATRPGRSLILHWASLTGVPISWLADEDYGRRSRSERRSVTGRTTATLREHGNSCSRTRTAELAGVSRPRQWCGVQGVQQQAQGTKGYQGCRQSERRRQQHGS